MLTRRAILKSATVLAAASAGGFIATARSATAASADKITHSDAEWKTLLTADQYEVLRHEGTERAFTSALLEEHRDGTYSCAG
jgi:peptide-methionine (R)-S-oxide reductase